MSAPAQPSEKKGHAYECMMDGNCRRVFADCEAAGRCLAATPPPGDAVSRCGECDYDPDKIYHDHAPDAGERAREIALGAASLDVKLYAAAEARQLLAPYWGGTSRLLTNTEWEDLRRQIAQTIAAALQSERTAAASQAHIPSGDAATVAWAEIERLGVRTHPGMAGGDVPLIMIAEGRLRTIIAGAASQARRETALAEKVIEAAREWATPDNFYSHAAQRKFLEALAAYDRAALRR